MIPPATQEYITRVERERDEARAIARRAIEEAEFLLRQAWCFRTADRLKGALAAFDALPWVKDDA